MYLCLFIFIIWIKIPDGYRWQWLGWLLWGQLGWGQPVDQILWWWRRPWSCLVYLSDLETLRCFYLCNELCFANVIRHWVWYFSFTIYSICSTHMVCIQILCLQNMDMIRVNPYIKTILSKTQENSRLKTRYLKGITTEQLFITSIQGIILSPLYLLTSLQNKLKQTRHTFYFLFYFTRSHNITIAIYIIIKITFYFVLASFF
jgi:hypothetical protein